MSQIKMSPPCCEESSPPPVLLPRRFAHQPSLQALAHGYTGSSRSPNACTEQRFCSSRCQAACGCSRDLPGPTAPCLQWGHWLGAPMLPSLGEHGGRMQRPGLSSPPGC